MQLQIVSPRDKVARLSGDCFLDYAVHRAREAVKQGHDIDVTRVALIATGWVTVRGKDVNLADAGLLAAVVG